MVYPELQLSTPQATAASFEVADPVVTANVYCAGRLDQAVVGPVAQLREKIREQQLGANAYLWFARYRKCGPHLKLRIHGPAHLAPLFRQLVSAACEPFLAALPEAAADPSAKESRGIPPIDVEDRQSESYPDRSLLFTTWERSHVSLGGRPFLDDDVYVEHLTRWLAASTDWLLDELKLDESGQVPYRQRQSLLMKMVLSALGTLELPNEKRAAYLHYHRDWLLRFFLLSSDHEEKALVVLESFGKRVAAMSGSLGAIERTLQRLWLPEAVHDSALRSLAAHAERFRGDAGSRVDPFTEEPAFPGVFKGLHGTANQLGLSMLDEAFTHHLLLSIAAPERAAQPIGWMPD